MIGPVSVSPAQPEERSLIEGLFQFYVYDFSEMSKPGSTDLGFNAHGKFPVDALLDAYWSEEQRWPLIIRVAGSPAGFALLNTHSHHGGTVHRNMAEFFVARKFRRHGVASEAVRQIFSWHPGGWEVAIAEQNAAAKIFWPKAIRSAPGVTRFATVPGDGIQWNGLILSFQVA
jgi:predicted acetyltransferase